MLVCVCVCLQKPAQRIKTSDTKKGCAEVKTRFLAKPIFCWKLTCPPPRVVEKWGFPKFQKWDILVPWRVPWSLKGVSKGALGANLHTLIAAKVAEYIRNCRRDDGRNWTMSFPKKGALKALL